MIPETIPKLHAVVRNFFVIPGQIEKLIKEDDRLTKLYNGQTALEFAVNQSPPKWKVVNLICNLAKPTEHDPQRFGYVLLRAAECKQWDLVEALIQCPFITFHWVYYDSPVKTNTSGFLALHFLILHNNTELLPLYLAKTHANRRYKNYPTPLTLAAKSTQIMPATLECLLTHAKEINLEKKERGKTPLHLAAKTGQAEKVRLLIQRGASLTAHDNNGRTPLRLAAESQNWEVVQGFFEVCHPTEGDPEGFGVALSHALHHQQWALVRMAQRFEGISHIYENYITSYTLKLLDDLRNHSNQPPLVFDQDASAFISVFLIEIIQAIIEEATARDLEIALNDRTCILYHIIHPPKKTFSLFNSANDDCEGAIRLIKERLSSPGVELETFVEHTGNRHFPA